MSDRQLHLAVVSHLGVATLGDEPTNWRRDGLEPSATYCLWVRCVSFGGVSAPEAHGLEQLIASVAGSAGSLISVSASNLGVG